MTQNIVMTVHKREDLERISRFTRRRYSHALMSDTKWRKLFDAVNGSGWHPSRVVIKFVDTDEPEDQLWTWPGEHSFWGPRQWVDSTEFGGPIELRSIEWLIIPATVVPPFRAHAAAAPMQPQDFTAIKSALSKVGQFPIEETPEGLKIIGYR